MSRQQRREVRNTIHLAVLYLLIGLSLWQVYNGHVLIALHSLGLVISLCLITCVARSNDA